MRIYRVTVTTTYGSTFTSLHTHTNTQIYNLTFCFIFKVSIISFVDTTCKKHLTPIVMAKGCRFFLKGPQVDMITDVYTRTHTCSVLT